MLEAPSTMPAGGSISSRARAWAEWALLAVFAIFWTGVAWLVWPTWDDGSLWLSARALTLDQFSLMYADRPVHGWLETHMAAADVTRQASAVAHALVWFGSSVVGVHLWRRLFPDRGRLAFVVGVVAISPIFITTQVVVANPTWSTSLPALLVWVPVVLLWPLPRAGEGPPSRGFIRLCGMGLGAVSVAAGCLISEYGVAAALAGGTLLAVLGARKDPTSGGASWKPGVVLIVFSLAAYGAFRSTIHGGFREEIGPGYLAQHLVQRAISFPFFLATSVWQAIGGVVLSRISGVRILLAGMERVTVLAVALGIGALAATLKWLEAEEQSVAEPDAVTGSWFERMRIEVALIAGVAAGLVPFCLTARVPAEDGSSRYFAPVLPIVAVLSLALLSKLFHAPRARRVVPAVLVGTAIYWSVTNAGAAIKDRQRVRQWAHEIEPHIAEGPTLVILTSTMSWPPYTRNYELTARFRHDMRAASLEHLWVAREIPATDAELKLVPAATGSHDRPRLAVGWYHVIRVDEPLARIVWASVQADGHLTIVESDY